jgi:hypothetical protein
MESDPPKKISIFESRLGAVYATIATVIAGFAPLFTRISDVVSNPMGVGELIGSCLGVIAIGSFVCGIRLVINRNRPIKPIFLSSLFYSALVVSVTNLFR